MTEREIAILKAISEEFSTALSVFREDMESKFTALKKEVEEVHLTLHKAVADIDIPPEPDISALAKAAAAQIALPDTPSIEEIISQVQKNLEPLPAPALLPMSDALKAEVEALVVEAVANIPPPPVPELPDIQGLIDAAIAQLPPPEAGKSVTLEEIKPLLEEMVSSALNTLPMPKDGKDYDPLVLKQAVADAVSEAVAVLPAALPGKDGEDGRDALALEILPFIDEAKNYPRGTYATHLGGLWRAFEKTHGMRGWECVVDGVAGVEINRAEERGFTLTVKRASGSCETKSFDMPVMIYRGVFRAEKDYHPGDTVTWGGSLWHCDEYTRDKPGDIDAKGWTLAAKRGRDGRDNR
uniref:phage gp6-like head-tail connector protein n=1 Tax=Hafnia alvei TaxID=569 RepID=UPI0024321EBC|nr:phage gp6-like head-tail connector protein [Hafnia alvei]